MPAPTQSFNFFTFIAATLLAWKYWGTVLNNHMNQLRKDGEVFHMNLVSKLKDHWLFNNGPYGFDGFCSGG